MSEPLPVGKLASEQLRALLGILPGDPSLIQGPGVGLDVAVVDAGGPRLLLLKSDPITFATKELGRYAVQVNANDIACAGGTPRWFLATLLLPEGGTSQAHLGVIFDQLRTASEEMGVCLVGGHTEVTGGLNRPIVCGTMVGEVEREKLVTPAGVKAGDAILLTRPVAIEGTATVAIERGSDLLSMGCCPDLIGRCKRLLAEPGISVVHAARLLCSAVPVHAMHDPTEGGVATALWELSEASGRGIEISPGGIPVLPETDELCTRLGIDPLGLLASGSLLVAVAAQDREAAIAACVGQGIPCAAIGEATSDGPGVWMMAAAGARLAPRFDQDEITRVL